MTTRNTVILFTISSQPVGNPNRTLNYDHQYYTTLPVDTKQATDSKTSQQLIWAHKDMR